MGIRNFPVITLGTDTCVSTAAITTASNIPIPNTQDGGRPKYLHIKCILGTGVDDYVSVTPDVAANNGAIATGFLLSGYFGQEIILNVHGYSHIGYAKTGAGTAQKLVLSPLEDF